MQMTPYLNFDGRCREAFEFYRDVLGGEITGMMTYGESPKCDEMPAGMLVDRFGTAWIIKGNLTDSNQTGGTS